MSQNYPVYEVIHGITLPALGPQVEVYVVQQGTPTTPTGPPYNWSPTPPDPANLAVTQGNANIPGNVYVVGQGTGNGTYSTTAAAKAAAIAYAQSLETARDQNVVKQKYTGGDASGAITPNADSPVFGPS